jgi:hypothetical protein
MTQFPDPPQGDTPQDGRSADTPQADTSQPVTPHDGRPADPSPDRPVYDYGDDDTDLGEDRTVPPSAVPTPPQPGLSPFAASLQQDDPHGQGSSDNHARHALWVFNGCLILLFAALVIGAVFVVRHVIDEQAHDPNAASSSAAEPTTASGAASGSTDPTDAASDPSDDPTGGPEGNPSEGPTDPSDASAHAGPSDALPAGSPVTVPAVDGGDLEVSTGPVDWDADKAIEKAGPSFNPKAPDGQKYVLVPVHATYHGKNTSTPGVEVSIEFVGQDGADHRQEVVVTPEMWTDHTDLPDGKSATWDLAFLVPEDTKDGTLRIHSFLTDGDQDAIYVSAR